MKTVRLGVSQLQHVNELLKEWSQSEQEKFKDYDRRLRGDEYDAELHGEVVRRYVDYVVDQLTKAGELGIELVLLPEGALPVVQLCRRKTRKEFLDICHWSVPEYLERIAPIAKEYGMVIASCVFRAEGDKLYNSGIVTDANGEVAGIYDKTHLPNYPDDDFTESGVFTAGNEYKPIKTKVGKVGFLICYDIDFPEPAMCFALEGAEILLHPTVGYNFPDEENSLGEARMRTRATDTHLPLLYSNFNTGRGPSCIIDHSGTVVAKAPQGRAAIVFADVPVAEGRMQGWLRPEYEHRSHLRRKRRPDTYGVLTRRIPPVLKGYEKRDEPVYFYREEVGLG